MNVPVTPVVTADLPGLPGVPASIAPLTCPECGERTAVVHHQPAGDGRYWALLRCGDCGAIVDLEAIAYLVGLAAGVLAERAKNAPKPRRPVTVHRRDATRMGWTSCGLAADAYPVAADKDPVTCRRCNPYAPPREGINHTLTGGGS